MKVVESILPQLTSHPTIGQQAPDFTADSTHGTIRLQDYRGSWVVLSSHPFELSPDRRWDEPLFSLHYRNLRAMNCELIGVDVEDTLTALHWCLEAREELGLKIWFPIIPDIDGTVAQLYGMVVKKQGVVLHIHVICIIDARHILRAVVYYDRNSTEVMTHLLKLIELLQRTDAQGVVFHQFWQNDWTLLSDDEAARAQKSCACGSDDALWYF